MESIHDNYYEGVLQLRNVNKKVLDFAINEIEKDNTTKISKIMDVKNGFDIFITRQKFLRSLGNSLQKRFHGQLLMSRRLHTKNRQTSREIYRISLLFRLPSFKKGDVIRYKGDEIKILHIYKRVLAKDIKSGKKLNLSFKDLMR